MDGELEQRPDTFVVHVAAGQGGALTGHIHHIRTGEKRRFDDVQGLTAALLGMVNGRHRLDRDASRIPDKE